LSISRVFKNELAGSGSERGCHNGTVTDTRRPDPQQGVFETMLVLDGHPVEPDAHLSRLNTSLAELFPDRIAPDLGDLEAPVESGSLQITVTPVGSELEVKTSIRRVEQRPRPLALNSLLVPSGLGAHKWADRSLLDEAQANLPADALPLVVDEDGTALEASRANLFAVRGGTLFTPPLDGRILPGVTRMRVLEIAPTLGLEIEETELSVGDLLNADEVFLTGSVRGIEGVRIVDGAPLNNADIVTDCLATELWQGWAGAKTAFREPLPQSARDRGGR
jgi:para-aminobenzoate synthetase / 4-amino-4-deoxychorismate lyase